MRTRLKVGIVVVVLLLIAYLCVGCQEYAAGVATGAAAVAKMNEDAQTKFVEAINALNDETARINETVDEVEGTVLVKPETLDALKGLKGREKDPVTWIALAELLGLAVLGGRKLQKSATEKKS